MVNNFEYALVNGFNRYFEEEGIKALAYRNKQFKYADQNFDIYVDSRDLCFYLAIECKSVDANKTKKIYYTQHFHGTGSSHQIVRDTKILNLSGRAGFLAVEARKGSGKKSAAWLVPWRIIEFSYNNQESGLWPEQITYNLALTKKGGAYEITDKVVEDLVKLIEGPVVKRYIPKKRK